MKSGLVQDTRHCVLLELGAEVYSIERIKSLYDKAKLLLHEMGYHPNVLCGDGTLGWPEFAPFDKIIVTAAAPEIPQLLLDQLKIGGILVTPVGDRETQVMYRIYKISDKDIIKQELDLFKFVPLIGEKGWKK